MRRAALLLLLFFFSLFASCTPAPRVEARAEGTLATLRARFPGVLGAIDEPARDAPSRIAVDLDASGVTMRDAASGIGARMRTDRPWGEREDVDGLSVFVESGVVVRVGPDAVEDFVSFEAPPAREEIVYTLAPMGGARLRLVDRSLELVDANGAPRLRMRPPWIVGRDGKRHDASLAIEGCAYDANPAAPWGRELPLPGADRCVLRIGWSGVAYPALLDPAWSTTASLERPRDEHTAVKLANGKVLIVFGQECSGSCEPVIGASDLYDPTTKTFANTGGGLARIWTVPGLLLPNGKALVLAGSLDGVTSYAALYDPTTGTFGAAGNSTVGRAVLATLTSLTNGKVLAAGGNNGLSLGNGAPSNAEVYDPATDTFGAPIALTTAHVGHTATLLANGKVLIAGGGTSVAELYDPATNASTATGSMASARTRHAAFRLANGKVLVVGGGNPIAELYDPATGTFAPTGAISGDRSGIAAAVMTSGNVYVVGGFEADFAVGTVERYDPASGTFTTAQFLARPRGGHTVTLLDDGKLLAIGGRTRATGPGSSIERAEELSVNAPGAACTFDDDCTTGICDRGICCATACTGTCMSCVAGTGVCAKVTNADDPSSCTGQSTCDAAGACKKKNGLGCAANAECASGSCVDGFCCNTPCTGPCEACDGATPGTCSVVAGAPHGNRTCASDGTACGGACAGQAGDTCSFPGIDTGCGTSCSGSQRTARTCNGKGACEAQEPRACQGNFACANDATCRTSCTTNAECARGYACSEAKCVPTAYCDGDHTIIGADGTSKTDCTPFRCDEATNGCLTSCADVEGCAEPFFCDESGQCVAPPKAPSGCATEPRSSPTSFIIGALVVLAATMRRRR